MRSTKNSLWNWRRVISTSDWAFWLGCTTNNIFLLKTFSWSFWETQGLEVLARPVESWLTFNNMSGSSTCTFKFENHCFKCLLLLCSFNLFPMKWVSAVRHCNITKIYSNMKMIPMQKPHTHNWKSYYHQSYITKDKLGDLAAWIGIIVSTRSIKVRPISLAYIQAYDAWAQSNHITITYKLGFLDILNTCNFWNSYYLSHLCTLYILILLVRMSPSSISW